MVFEILTAGQSIAEMYVATNFFRNIKLLGAQEELLSKDQERADKDGDGLLDVWELAYGFDIDDTGTKIEDADLDGLTNLEEFKRGTNPLRVDTDGDGYGDGVEVDKEANPLVKEGFEIPFEQLSFGDVSEDHPNFAAIQELYRQGFLKGFGEGFLKSFKPDQPITRAEFIKVVLGSARCHECVNPTEEEKEHFKARENNPDLAAYNKVSETGRQLAFDQDKLNREEFFHYPDTRDPGIWQDDWFYYCVEIATEMGLVHGYKGEDDRGNNATGLFLPHENISRAEAVKVFLEAADLDILAVEKIYDQVDEQGNSITEGWYYDSQLNYIYSAIEYDLLVPDSSGRVYPERKISRGEMAEMAAIILKITRFGLPGDIDEDRVLNKFDLAVCIPEDIDGVADSDGIPESDTEELKEEVLAPVEEEAPPREIESLILKLEPAVCLVSGDKVCQRLEPIADLADGDVVFAAISDESNEKVWAKSEELLYRE